MKMHTVSEETLRGYPAVALNSNDVSIILLAIEGLMENKKLSDRWSKNISCLYTKLDAMLETFTDEQIDRDHASWYRMEAE